LPFHSDFGPVILGKTYRYFKELQKLLSNPDFAGSKVFHYTKNQYDKRANSAYLMGAFQVVVLGRFADSAWELFSNLSPFRAFRDALPGVCSYACTILHCLKGLERTVALGWFSLESFNIAAYEFNARLENGYFSWIIPRRMLAFANPALKPFDEEGCRTWTPEDYYPVFKLI
jgi:cell division cycle 14